jgi:hypothetical protein
MQVKRPSSPTIRNERVYGAAESIWLGQVIQEVRAASQPDENIFDAFKRLVFTRFHLIGMQQIAMARETGYSPRAVNYYMCKFGTQDKQIRQQQKPIDPDHDP